MHAPSRPEPRPRYLWPLHRFACFCAGAVLCLICLGGLVTSNEAGMSVPDWPTTYGYNMFYFPWKMWTGGIVWEHSHRLMAFGVSTLVAILGVALCFQERVWLRWMGLIAPFFFLGEATLGGLRVVFSEDKLGIFHGMLAQLLFVGVSLIALFTSRSWIEGRAGLVPSRWPVYSGAICGLIFCQLLIGATMRHEHAGLSIPDFPLAYGQVWPKTDAASVAAYNLERLRHNQMATDAFYIDLQMTHRVGAVLIAVTILAAALHVWRTAGSAPFLRRWTAVWVGLVVLQVILGACTIWTNKAADVATTHVAVGALTLVTGALLTAMSWRLQAAPLRAGRFS